jgi:maltodextrin utilization protein YvdJ
MQPNDFTALDFRIKLIEKEMQHLRSDLRQCVSTSVNELQLQSIRSTVERIESEVREAKSQVTSLNTQLSNQAKEQDQIQIKVLTYVVVTILSLLGALIVAYFAHVI